MAEHRAPFRRAALGGGVVDRARRAGEGALGQRVGRRDGAAPALELLGEGAGRAEDWREADEGVAIFRRDEQVHGGVGAVLGRRDDPSDRLLGDAERALGAGPDEGVVAELEAVAAGGAAQPDAAEEEAEPGEAAHQEDEGEEAERDGEPVHGAARRELSPGGEAADDHGQHREEQALSEPEVEEGGRAAREPGRSLVAHGAHSQRSVALRYWRQRSSACSQRRRASVSSTEEAMSQMRAAAAQPSRAAGQASSQGPWSARPWRVSRTASCRWMAWKCASVAGGGGEPPQAAASSARAARGRRAKRIEVDLLAPARRGNRAAPAFAAAARSRAGSLRSP